ncbi:MAG: hypothetical protein QXL78_04280 [Methanocellales archaeon]
MRSTKNLGTAICGTCKYLAKNSHLCKFNGYCAKKSMLQYIISRV